MKTILVVTKDVRPGMIATAIVRELAGLGWEEPTVVAEAASLKEWDKARGGVEYRGPAEFNKNNLWDLDAGAVLDKERPSAVLVGLSSPMNLEQDFLAAAFRRSIPTIAIDDNWNAFRRARPVATMYLTIDKLGQHLIKGSSYGDAFVEIIGDMAAGEPSAKAKDLVSSLRREDGPVVILATQKWDSSIDTIKLALSSLEVSALSMDFVVIPRIHPGASPENKKKWEEYLRASGQPGDFEMRWLEDTAEFKWNSDHLSMLADVTIAATGTGLRAAAYNGRMPVCVSSPTLEKDLKSETGGDPKHPLVVGGAGIELNGVYDLFDLVRKKRSDVRNAQHQLLSPKLFDPRSAAEAINTLVS